MTNSPLLHHLSHARTSLPPPAADVSRYAGRYEHVFESTTAGVTIQAPQLDINTVAAGGGSRLFFRSGVFQARGQWPGGNISEALPGVRSAQASRMWLTCGFARDLGSLS